MRRGFTLTELLVVIAIVAVLAALLLPSLWRAKSAAQATVCRANLRQIGIAMTMYLSDFSRYPPLWDEEAQEIWFTKLRAYSVVDWTSRACQCPSYLARKGEVYLNRDGNTAGSYAYNWRGTVGWSGCPKELYKLTLGLGHLSKDAAREPEVLVPTEMYIVADARPHVVTNGISGNPKMELYAFAGLQEAPAPHGDGYDILLGDGRVHSVTRSNYLFPPRAAHHWNRDNQSHPETWAPFDQWAVRN